ncbi:hypothetical protein [Endozoicomonas sp. ALB115]|uniref:hypothetical protein n=1 Tax=Endozoicomonas TaxID=305899 RepID=UPI003BB74FFB
MNKIFALVFATLVIQLHGYWEVSRLPTGLAEWGTLLLLSAIVVSPLIFFQPVVDEEVNDGSEV